MGQMSLMYLLGFGGVWLGVALVWFAVVGYRRYYRDNWDRAFIQELAGGREELRPKY